MKNIESFLVNHTILEKGIYLSRQDDDIITYDIRMVKPNTPPYLENSGIHTFEHLFATYARNSEFTNNVVYVGPMGCRTGFYFVVRNISHTQAIKLMLDSFEFIASFTGDVPGVSAKECGNYLEHDLELAKVYAKDILAVTKNWNENKIYYSVK